MTISVQTWDEDTHHVVGHVEDLGVRGQAVRKSGQIELGAVGLHPQRVVDVDDVAIAAGWALRLDLLERVLRLSFAQVEWS